MKWLSHNISDTFFQKVQLTWFKPNLLYFLNNYFPLVTRVCLYCRKPGFDHWVRKISWRRKWQLTPVFLSGEPHGQRRMVGYSAWGLRVRDGWRTKSFFHLVIPPIHSSHPKFGGKKKKQLKNNFLGKMTRSEIPNNIWLRTENMRDAKYTAYRNIESNIWSVHSFTHLLTE